MNGGGCGLVVVVAWQGATRRRFAEDMAGRSLVCLASLPPRGFAGRRGVAIYMHWSRARLDPRLISTIPCSPPTSRVCSVARV